jgi:hypothetical protein
MLPLLFGLLMHVVAGSHTWPPNCTQSFPWYDWRQPLEHRIDSLLAALTIPEKIAQLNNGAPAVPRLCLPAYDFKSEAAHGIGWAGRATVFPAAIAMAATFHEEAVRQAGCAACVFPTIIVSPAQIALFQIFLGVF